MKKILFMLFFSLVSTSHLMGQSTESTVSLIKRQINEVIALESRKQSTGCQSASKNIYKSIGGSNMKYPQSTTLCNYPGGYKVITSKFEDWEMFAVIKYYIKNNELLFVLNSYENVSTRYEYRTYYNNNRIIRILERDVLGGIKSNNNNEDVTYNNKTANWVKNFNNRYLSESLKMLK